MVDYKTKCTGTWTKEAGIHLVLSSFNNEARVAAKSVPPSRAHQAAEAVRARAEMKSKSVSSSESEDSDEGVDPDLEYEDSDAQDYKHTEDEDPKGPAPEVAAVPAAAAPVVLPKICLPILRPLPLLVRPSYERRVATVRRFVCA